MLTWIFYATSFSCDVGQRVSWLPCPDRCLALVVNLVPLGIPSARGGLELGWAQRERTGTALLVVAASRLGRRCLVWHSQHWSSEVRSRVGFSLSTSGDECSQAIMVGLCSFLYQRQAFGNIYQTCFVVDSRASS